MTPLQSMIEMARQESAVMIADAPSPCRGRPLNGAARTAIITMISTRGELTRQQLADGAGMTPKQFDHYVAGLEAEGRVVRRRQGHKTFFSLPGSVPVQEVFDL